MAGGRDRGPGDVGADGRASATCLEVGHQSGQCPAIARQVGTDPAGQRHEVEQARIGRPGVDGVGGQRADLPQQGGDLLHRRR